MKILAKNKIYDFLKVHTDCTNQSYAWCKEVSNTIWNNAEAIKTNYPRAEVINDNLVVFPLKKTRYVFVTEINFSIPTIKIHFAGTQIELEKFLQKKRKR